VCSCRWLTRITITNSTVIFVAKGNNYIESWKRFCCTSFLRVVFRHCARNTFIVQIKLSNRESWKWHCWKGMMPVYLGKDSLRNARPTNIRQCVVQNRQPCSVFFRSALNRHKQLPAYFCSSLAHKARQPPATSASFSTTFMLSLSSLLPPLSLAKVRAVWKIKKSLHFKRIRKFAQTRAFF